LIKRHVSLCTPLKEKGSEVEWRHSSIHY